MPLIVTLNKPKKKDKYISFFTTKEQAEKLEEISRIEGISRSQLIREAIDFFLAYYAERKEETTKAGTR
ncbi:MAG TPA: ribbon-helix-helix domain-containing protein [Anaerolineae bacterium]|nr:ribbon-helix-helix domain-containing protein [Anaerolineae bacterium]